MTGLNVPSTILVPGIGSFSTQIQLLLSLLSYWKPICFYAGSKYIQGMNHVCERDGRLSGFGGPQVFEHLALLVLYLEPNIGVSHRPLYL